MSWVLYALTYPGRSWLFPKLGLRKVIFYILGGRGVKNYPVLVAIAVKAAITVSNGFEI